MSRTAPEREFLGRFAAAASSPGGLARAAVLLARVQCPDADPDRVEGILETLARRVRALGAGASSAADRARVLSGVLAEDRGLAGNRGEYDDPRNSCLECVLDRRLGIPLSLSLVWMEAGRRAGWVVEGVGLPGHFVARVRGEGGKGVLVDPFHGGGVVDRADLRRMLRGIHGGPVALGPRMLRPLGPRDLLLRMLRNLRGSYRRRGDRARGIAVAEDMLLLAPGLPEALRDRGMLRLEGGDRKGGLADLREFLERDPGAPGADLVYRLVSAATDDAEMPN